MTITLRQKDLENDNKSLYLDIYDNGKRKFEYLSALQILSVDSPHKSVSQISSCNGTLFKIIV